MYILLHSTQVGKSVSEFLRKIMLNQTNNILQCRRKFISVRWNDTIIFRIFHDMEMHRLIHNKLSHYATAMTQYMAPYKDNPNHNVFPEIKKRIDWIKCFQVHSPFSVGPCSSDIAETMVVAHVFLVELEVTMSCWVRYQWWPLLPIRLGPHSKNTP